MNADNKLIAEFLGYSQPHPDYPDTTYWYKKDFPPLTILSFDTDWNWLIQVVKKIESLNKLDSVLINTDIKEVYNACVEFIKWYNEQPK
jgi:hypothetical protein